MKSLLEYINENIDSIFESESDNFKYLINYWDSLEDESLLCAKDFWDKSDEIKKYISKEDLEKIYKYRDEHSNDKEIKARPEPLVANYGNKEGNFAFRRWVKRAIDDLNIKKIPDSKFHNTNLKGNGSWVPTAQDMEDIIAMGYNNIHEFKLAEEIKNNKIEKIIAYYQEHKDVIDKIASVIDDGDDTNDAPLKKLDTTDIKVTEKWESLGEYKENNVKPNRTPKTDIISENNVLRISLKEEGGSQLMSGGYCEAKATMLTAIEKAGCKDDKDAKKLVELLKNKWVKGFKSDIGIADIKKNKAHKDYEYIMNVTTNQKNIQDILNKLVTNNDKFKKALLYEAMTGEAKFGVSNPATANYVLVWNDTNPELSKFYTPDEYIAHLEKSKIQFLINFKSSNNSAWENMRIVCGNAKAEDSPKVEIDPKDLD